MASQVDPRFEINKYQRNELFNEIQQLRVPIVGFELSVVTVRVHFRKSSFSTNLGLRYKSFDPGRPFRQAIVLRHAETASLWGVINYGLDRYRIRFDIGGRKPESRVLRHWNSPDEEAWWTHVPYSARLWAEKIKKILDEAEAQDLWAELNYSKQLLSGGAERDADSTAFTAVEQAEVSVQVHGMKAYVRTVPELTLEKVVRIEAQLDHLVKASEKVSKKDWLLMFGGSVTGLVLSDVLPEQTAQHIVVLAVNGLGHLFGTGSPMLPLPPGK